ncbi:MAG TPA: hypothetical protein VGF45_22355, partial [Polyangia bacterium]
GAKKMAARVMRRAAARVRGAKPGRRTQFASRALVVAGGIAGLGFAGFLGLSWLHKAVAHGQAPPVASATVAAPPARPEKVKITFATVPPGTKTELRWGKRKLGVLNANPKNKKPFFIERPKDSGPLDLVARAEGFLPLNTRVYTYTDNKVLLRLTPETEKHTILGYKVEIPDAGADGGGPSPAGADAGVLMPPPSVGPQLPAPLQPVPAAPPQPQ